MKNWLTKDKQYRIYWRSEAFGIALPPRFFAFKWDVGTWTFATVKRPFKTLNKAIAECEKDAWNKLQHHRVKRQAGTGIRNDLVINPNEKEETDT